jgi:hypothetical protein
MNMKTNMHTFFNKIVYGICGLFIISLLVILLRLSTHAWISRLIWN